MQIVSRETEQRLSAFEALVLKWTPKINLIAPSTITDIRRRHTLDSLQVFSARPNVDTWLDIGSGGGFPGIVVAIAMQEHSDKTLVTLVESDRRKCVFLRQAARELGLSVTVVNERIEQLDAGKFQTISARALAPLPRLISYAHAHLEKDGEFIALKGQSWKKELEQALLQWSFAHDVVQSESEENAVLLKLSNIKRNL